MTFEYPDPLLTDREAASILGIAKPTLWKWVREGKLPKPIKLGYLSRWPKSEIFDVIERAKAARNAA